MVIFVQRRTDLALETEKITESDGFYTEKDGVFEFNYAEIKENESKNAGKYITLSFCDLQKITDFEVLEKQFKKALEALAGVESATPSHTEKQAVVTLTSPVSDETLKSTVEAQGYKVLGIE